MLDNYQKLITEAIVEHQFKGSPQNLYDPNNYILAMGGKRLRPMMVVMSCELFGGNVQEVLKPALAIEFFHNFTLMHDDIMDSAPLRRGKETVHMKYDVNAAILSGDALLIKAYQYFEDLAPESFKKVVKEFSKIGAELCEGQQYDLNFMTQKDVSIEEYMDMITLKTGVMVAGAFKIGAIIAQASDENTEKIYAFGKNLGIAFQLMDDYLDVFGNAEDFGKKVGGDIHENKKTILYIMAKKKGNPEDVNELGFWYSMKTENIDKIYAVEKLFKKLRVNEDIMELINTYTHKALNILKEIEGDETMKGKLVDLSNILLNRNV